MAKANPAFELPAVEKAGIRELHPLDGALLLMHFAFRGLVSQADRHLEKHAVAPPSSDPLRHRAGHVIFRAEGVER